MRLLFALLLTIATTATAVAERRVALVMADNDYRLVRPLANPIHDGEAMEAALKKLGFEVILETNRDLRRMRRALDDFRDDAKGADVALVYFSGHGVEISGDNRLLPVDADASSVDQLDKTSLPLEEVRDAVAATAKVGLIVLDACRSDPFSASSGDGRGATSLAKDVADKVKPGLGRVGRAENILFAFSAAPGETAADGTGENSPFTTALTKYLATDGLEIRSVLTLVQQEVYDLSRGKQLPYVESGLPKLFFAAAAKEQLPERERLLLAMADVTPEMRGEVEQIASDADMPLAPLYGALISSDASHLSADSLNARLREAADAFVKVRSEMKTLASDDPQVAELRRQAEEQLSLGAFDGARALLAKAADIDNVSRQALKVNFASRTLSEAATRFLSGGAARADLDYTTAIGDFETVLSLYGEAGQTSLSLEQADRQSRTLEELGILYTTVGNVEAAGRAFTALLTNLEQRSRQETDPSVKRDLAISHIKLANIKMVQGDLPTSLEHYEAARDMLQDLTASVPDEKGWLGDLAMANDKIGNVLATQGDVGAAAKAYQQSLSIKQKLVDAQPNSASLLRDLTITYDEIGDLARTTGQLDGAQTAFEESLRIRLVLAENKPDPERQRAVSVSHERIGDVLRERGDAAGALVAYSKSQAIAEELVRHDPNDTDLKRDLSISYAKIGNALNDQENWPAALASYQQALAVARELAADDPGNTDWQRDLSVCLEKVAGVLDAQGDIRSALQNYQDSLAIVDRLTKLDPGNSDWQRDLSITLSEIGMLETRQRHFEGSRKAFEASLGIRQKLAQSDPNNAIWQFDLVQAYINYAYVAKDPKAVLTKALNLTLDLDRTGRLAPRDKPTIKYLRGLLAKLNAGKK
ncbi:MULTISPECIES: caspase family protein [Mesorhizobium]|uniref:Peptidase C14 n=1 Tax=Rhizobium loti TaxID=381 RepID=A0A1A5JS36_RHILI|nr:MULTISPECIES: caspase family protein [Mesorhizobium]OBP73904.1 peptidase C14 [Mesorhizobium loti]OBP76037.1 peptidase C14 [Mesorhizobium loti]OBP82394.1 peptidase C14 [Mesorhizobium loti]OBP94199.1 peptidase C14 [Mesorhizobium loti]OBP97704.1 peptidase C14 [Mesorhizobium loti]